MGLTHRRKMYLRNAQLEQEQQLENRRLQALGLRPPQRPSENAPGSSRTVVTAVVSSSSSRSSHSPPMAKRPRKRSSSEDVTYLSEAAEILATNQITDRDGRPGISYTIRWKRTFEEYDEMLASVPELVSNYEHWKTNKVVKVLGPENNSFRTEYVPDALFVVELINGERSLQEYSDLREQYPSLLIDFYMRNINVCDPKKAQEPVQRDREQTPIRINLDDDDSILDIRGDEEVERARSCPEQELEDAGVSETMNYLVDSVSEDLKE